MEGIDGIFIYPRRGYIRYHEVDGGQLREMFVFVFMCYAFLVFVSLV